MLFIVVITLTLHLSSSNDKTWYYLFSMCRLMYELADLHASFNKLLQSNLVTYNTLVNTYRYITDHLLSLLSLLTFENNGISVYAYHVKYTFFIRNFSLCF